MSLALLIAIMSLIAGSVGYFMREVREVLTRIRKAVLVLVQRQQKQEQQEKKMTFADPINWEELDEQEKIALLN